VHALTGPHGTPLRVFTWPVDDAPAARTVTGYGVDGVISDKPDVVRTALYYD
jgi:glycerophosphoryl diester phosphodiesterase